jgi:hypothetical protein
MITNQQEYKLNNGQTISIQLNKNTWEVACWNKDGTAHWYKEFTGSFAEEDAKKEFEHWR